MCRTRIERFGNGDDAITDEEGEGFGGGEAGTAVWRVRAKKRCEDLSRRPITAMDCYFLTPNSTANSQTIPDESVTCIAVKEDIRTLRAAWF